MSIFNYVNWFFMYSFLGYLLECIVLTIEYKKPVVDRGFGCSFGRRTRQEDERDRFSVSGGIG